MNTKTIPTGRLADKVCVVTGMFCKKIPSHLFGGIGPWIYANLSIFKALDPALGRVSLDDLLRRGPK